MKEWNAPSIEELNVAETANGILNSDFETFIFFNDSFNKSNTPDSKDEEKDSVNQLS